MNSSRVYSSVATLTCAASFVVALAGCGSDTKTPTASSLSVTGAATSSVAAASACPTAAPQSGGTPEWTLAGSNGSVAVTGSTDTAAPRVTVTAPFGVTETQVHTLRAGDGPVVADTDTVSVCYMGVNGRDGSVFDSSYEQGAPVEFPLDGVVAGFKKAIAGQKVGSTVGVAMTSADGYPNGQPRAGIKAGDTLVFAIKILAVSQ
ncbi:MULTISPECIES: FKBP-type peptidyl-prolyl cis-trans isomerase [unclassified Mycobacteroides]|uniref:FKBP-type peptidyl-prolyl cis-trans isomerase n=1 Tax=unclassified Mycobacteroides TaxID=2618759 RepID=UPI0035C82BA9